MDMVWTEQLSVGNAVIDSEHKKLIALVNDITCATKEKDSSALLRALKPFKSFMSRHYIKEEQFAQALDFPFGLHDVAHQNLRTELDFTEQELKKNCMENIFVMEDYAQFLWDLLIKHITEEDMLMKPMLQTRPYDFKPG